VSSTGASRNQYLKRINDNATYRELPSDSKSSLNNKVKQGSDSSASEDIDAEPKRSYTTRKKPVFCGTDGKNE
jgi:hypothetical protein